MKKASGRRMLPLLAVVFMVVFGVSVPAYSQEPEKVVSGMTDGIYVNGLKMGEVYTEEQIVAAFGKYDRYDDGKNKEAMVYWFYRYGKGAYIDLEPSTRELVAFGIYIPDFRINGLFEVGDSIDRIPSDWLRKERSEKVFICIPPSLKYYDPSCWLEIYHDSNGIITSMGMDICAP